LRLGRKQAGDLLKQPITGVVLSLRNAKDQPPLDQERLTKILQSSPSIPVAAVIAPAHLADRGISKLPAYITSSPLPIAISVTFQAKGQPAETATVPDDIKMILSAGHVVDLDVPWDAAQAESESEWDGLEEVLGKSVPTVPAGDKPKAIIISNLLPPPHSLTIPIVRLLNHPTYKAYQDHISSLSFNPNVYLKFLPPSWQDPTPLSPGPGASFASTSSSETNNLAKDEWKRRVRMYLGPALDAFGYSRIIFGTSPSPSSSSASTAHDWYVLAREVVAEVGIDQEGVDAIFGGNAKSAYGL